jgi:hypothetical protein
VNLVIHIERVVLEGVTLDGHQRDRLRLRLEQELAGHLAGRTALTAELAGGAAVPRLSAAPVQLDPAGPGGGVADLASRVAGSVATTLAGPATGGRR